MDSLGFNNVWKILKDYDFPVDKVSAEFLCKLCKKIMINPYSVPCGCTYCKECIATYLGDEIKLCLGQTDECRNISKDSITINYQINNNISKLVVKCPEISCKFKSELKKMGEHIVEGKFQIINCPYQNIGCNSEEITHDSIKDHLRSHEHDHIKLLMMIIDDNLMKNIQKLEDQTGNLFNEFQQIKDNYKITIKALTEENIQLKEFINRLTQRSDETQANIENLTGENIALRNIITKLSEKTDEIQRSLIQKIMEVKVEILNEVKTLSDFQEKHNYGEFIWKINDFKRKFQIAQQQITPQIISKPFYSHKNGYKLCLRLNPNGIGDETGRSVSIFFSLMKGEFDDILTWPFQHSVTLAIINQNTKLTHASHTVYFNDFRDKTNFEKPNNRMNAKGFGTRRLILINDLLGNENLQQNDQIFIKCIVEIK